MPNNHRPANTVRTTSIRIFQRDATLIRICAAYYNLTAAEFIAWRFRMIINEEPFTPLPEDLVRTLQQAINNVSGD